MDPNANLEEQRSIAAELMATGFEHDQQWWSALAVRLADLVEALDGHLRSGGAWPRDWSELRDG